MKILLSVILLLLVVHFLSPAVFSTGAFEFETSMKLLGRGDTIIHLPPLGKITARTHLPPLDLHLSLKFINLQELSDLLGDTSFKNNWPSIFWEQIKGKFIRYLASFLVLSFFLGAGSSLLWSRKKMNKKEMGVLGSINVLVVILLVLFVAGFYNIGAFNRVEYQGMLEAAPLVFSIVEKGIELVDSMGVQAAGVVENISQLQEEMEMAADVTANSVKVLHVSDIHNNPAALDFIGSILETFHVDVIIDTGDLVDYGTVFETQIFADFFAELNLPYVFVPGNHDSPQVVDYLKEMEGVLVLEEGIIEVAGLTIAAVADPSSYYQESIIADDEAVLEAAVKLERIVQEGSPVDIIAAHNPDTFAYLRENGRLLLGGHIHTPKIARHKQYIEINAGTTGASGIRGIRDMDMTFSLVLLSFQSSEECSDLNLYAADMIKIKHNPLNYSLERVLFDSHSDKQETAF